MGVAGQVHPCRGPRFERAAGLLLHMPACCPHPCAQGEWDEGDPAKRIPSPLVLGLVRFFKGLICAALWTKLSGSYGPGAHRAG